MPGRTYNFWLTVRRAPDLPDQWVAHCLDLDVVTQGDSLSHAIMMAREAVCMVMDDDLQAGRDPLDRRAPDDVWAELYNLLSHSRPVDVNDIAAVPIHPDEVFVAQLVVRQAGVQPSELPWGLLSPKAA